MTWHDHVFGWLVGVAWGLVAAVLVRDLLLA